MTQAPTETRSASLAPAPEHNGMTAVQKAEAIAAAGRRTNDPEYLREWERIAAEYRLAQQKEADAEHAEEGK